MTTTRILLIAVFLFPTLLIGQVVSTIPVFPSATDSVTIIFDATLGNGAMEGISPVYAHTGLITSESGSPTDWQYVVGNWGTPDPDVLMEDIGDNKHQLRVHIPSYYGVDPTQEEVLELAFVFRNADGSAVGRASDGSDIYTPVFGSTGLFASIVSPTDDFLFLEEGNTIELELAASESCMMTLYQNGAVLNAEYTDGFNYSVNVSGDGEQTLVLECDNGSSVVYDTLTYYIPEEPLVEDPPAGTELGITHLSADAIRLSLYAPDKEFIYIIGDFNDWTVSPDYLMKKDVLGSTWHLDIQNLTPGDSYAFQYWVDGLVKTADPYSLEVLDGFNDGFIDNVTYPNLHPYPAGKTTGNCSLIHMDEAEFNWQHNDFEAPAKTDLVIYELLIRDFLGSHNYIDLKDTLSYLKNLGINAIELMPVNEFEGNISWGYNPSYHMATDKYYGTRQALKEFIDEAHGMGIAIIVDVVYNHAFSQSPLCQLYWDDANFRPSPENPWLNPVAKHDFNVGYDFNHQSFHTKAFTNTVIRYWLEEFRVDGYRFDLSKGFTQNNTLGNPDAMAQYDASRISILKDYADEVWSVNPDAYVIMEHFAVNAEESELSDYGMMLWSNMTHQYNEATMGYSSNLSGTSYTSKGWADPHLIAYMESHDEERLMYKNIQYGNQNGSYSTRDIPVGLERCGAAAAFYFAVPGPKMIWQFGELGYDVSINFDCRTCPKPIMWEYYLDQDRKKLHDVYQAMIHLKTEQPVFETTDFEYELGGELKDIYLNSADQNVVVIGNFGMATAVKEVNFQHTGTWYNYLNQNEFEVSNVNQEITLGPGDYRVFIDQPIALPSGLDPIISSIESVDESNINLILSNTEVLIKSVDAVLAVQVLDVNGKLLLEGNTSRVNVGDLFTGIYIVQVETNSGTFVEKLIID